MNKRDFFLLILFLISFKIIGFSQSYHVVMGGLGLYELEVTNHNSCTYEHVGQITIGGGCAGLTSTPDSLLLLHCHSLIVGDGLKEIDQTTAFFNNYFDHVWPLNTVITGVVSLGNGIYYALNYSHTTTASALYKIDINNGSVNFIGDLPYTCSAEMTLFNGEIYYPWHTFPDRILKGIVKVDTINPEASELIISISGNLTIRALTASDICNTLLAGTSEGNFIYYINLLDGVITFLCDSPLIPFNITSLVEFEAPEFCPILLDLDEDNSTGLPEYDYDGEEFDCHSSGVKVTDEDIKLLYDALITEMTIEIVGFIPDAQNEILEMTASIPNIEVAGAGTPFITLTNEGDAKSSDFKNALRAIRYNNNALDPTGGTRTINVQFSTESGATSNVATAFIEVVELPLVGVDLGPDQEICEGETVTFDAGHPGADYEWSTGATSQTITVDEEDEYIVTVSDGVNCPNQDTVELTLLPVVYVALEGQFQTCDNVPLTLTINTDSPFPLTVEISATPGSPFVLNNVIGSFTFNDLPTQETEYTITSVTPSQPACIEITDPIQLVDVYPSYIHSFAANICEGDSIWLGFYWETEPGVYENTFNTFEGCDSVVTTTVNVLPAINISIQSNTCDSSEAGVFVEYLNNPNGCDTVITTTVSLLQSDTTLISLSDCNAADTGLFQQVLTNLTGCDSIVITDVAYDISPSTFIDALTCDSSLIGVFQQQYIDQTGCDSIVVTAVNIAPGDTSYLYGVSCDPLNIGITEILFSNQLGCDSLVITTISAGVPDTTYFNTTSCDSASLGVFEDHFISQSGCDSTLFTTITYSANDSTFIQSGSCDAAEVGVFVQNLVNRFGCDSIVTTTINLLPTSETFLTSITCDEAEAGIFVDTFNNQFGCDSIVTQTVELLPSNETFLFSTTCMSSQAGMFITTHLNQYGCDSIVTLTVSLVPADTTVLLSKTCDPAQVGIVENTFTNQDGCDSLVIEQTTLYPLPELDLTVTSDYNGYAISCFGESDGSVSADVTGVPPWTYIWSTGDNDQTISGLSVGSYAVTVTDGNGCITSGDIMLFEPEEFSISFIVSQPDCFDHQDGSITVEQSSGIEPIRYSIDEINYQLSPVFDQLPGGTYTVTAIDANDCEVKEIIWINVPLMVHVELPGDQIAYPGDTVVINAIVNVPYDSLASVSWSGLNNPACPNCLSQPVAPIITTTYSVTVTSLDGCMDEDAMTLFLERNDDVLVPNIFSPNGDNINDRLVISAGSDVEEIKSLIIFDRWGNIVFEANNFLPNDLSTSWDGTMKGKEMNPGVFAYRMIVEFQNGKQNILYGDVTLIR